MGAISAASRLFFFPSSSNKLPNKFCISNISLQTNHQSAPLTPPAPAATLSKNKRESNTCLLISAPPGIGAVLLVQRANAVDLVAAAAAAAAVFKEKEKSRSPAMAAASLCQCASNKHKQQLKSARRINLWQSCLK